MVRQKSSERKDRHEQFKCVSHLNCGPTNSARHLPVGLVGFGFVARVVRLILIEFGAKRMNFGPLLSLVWNRGRKLSVAFSSCFLERKRARKRGRERTIVAHQFAHQPKRSERSLQVIQLLSKPQQAARRLVAHFRRRCFRRARA